MTNTDAAPDSAPTVRRPGVLRRPLVVAFAAAAALALLPAEGVAQFLPEGSRGRRAADSGPAIETAVVGRVGFDVQFQNLVLGGLARASFPLPLRPTVQAGGDLTFFDGLTDRGAGVDLLLQVIPGLHLGGGPYWRSSIFTSDPLANPELGADNRETRLGWSAVLHIGGIGGRGRTVTGVEFRWVELDEYNPQMLTLQFGLRLSGG